MYKTIVFSQGDLSKLISILFGLFLLFLPFNNILILDIGFPLKLYEIILGSILFFTGLRFIQSKQVIPLEPFYRKILFFIFIFILISFIYGAIHLQIVSEYFHLARISPLWDSFLKVLYMLIAFCLFFIARHFFDINIHLMKYFFMGAFIASVISIAFFILGFADIKPSILLDMHYQYINLGPASFIRNSTFLEGNFAGLYFLISFILAKHFKQKHVLWILPIAIVSTFSTIAIFTMCVYILLISFQNYRNFFYAIFLVILLISINNKTDGFFFKEQFLDKIPSTVAHSTVERSEMIKTGLEMFIQKPLFGMGPSNYKYYFAYLNQDKQENLKSLGLNSQRRPLIANNIYIELLAEYGIFVFLTFFIFIWKLFWNVYNQKSYYLSSGLIVVLIYFIAYPSFSVFYLWVFFAVLSLEKSQDAHH